MKNINSITLSNTTYQNKPLLEEVDLAYVPWENGSMSRAFWNCQNLTSVTNINENVTSMLYTFSGCNKLINSPVIPDSAIDMGWTFSGCWNLVNAPVIPNSVTNMYYTFQGCYNLVNAPDMSNASSVTDMTSTFSSCYNLVNVSSLPSNLIDMRGTFYGCRNLVNIPEIPNSVTNMGNSFLDCTNVLHLSNIPNSVVDMSWTFAGCSNLIDIEKISNSVISLNRTFFSCKQLLNVPVMPNSVADMYETFGSCSNLTGDIQIYSENISNAQNCFYNTSLDKNVYIPFTYENGVNTLTYNSFVNAGYSDTTRSQHGVLLKDMYAGPEDWRYDVLPGRIKLLYEYTGSNADVVVPNNHTMICSNSFNSANMPFYNRSYNSVDLNFVPFENNDMSAAFYVPDSSVPFSAPARAPGLPGGTDPIDPIDPGEQGPSVVAVYNINENVTNMFQTFYGCKYLTNAPMIPNSVTNMGETFHYCDLLANVPTLPSSITSMWYTFRNCSNLTGDIIILSENVANATNCFTDTSLNKNVYIPFTYENGVNTLTFNSFVNAGYSTDTRVNGVLLMDINNL